MEEELSFYLHNVSEGHWRGYQLDSSCLNALSFILVCGILVLILPGHWE